MPSNLVLNSFLKSLIELISKGVVVLISAHCILLKVGYITAGPSSLFKVLESVDSGTHSVNISKDTSDLVFKVSELSKDLVSNGFLLSSVI